MNNDLTLTFIKCSQLRNLENLHETGLKKLFWGSFTKLDEREGLTETEK
jgi:hypothetical protein